MAMQSLPYDGNLLSGDSGPYDSAEFRKLFFDLFGNRDSATNGDENAGVLNGVTEELIVLANNPTAANVIVNTGAALIQGMWVNNDADATIAVSANATGSTRYDIIFIQYDLTTRLPSVGIAVGTTNLPTLTQNLAGTYQIPLAYLELPNGFATVTSAMIFDMRVFANVPRRTKVLVQNVSGAAMNYGDLVVWSTATSQAVTTVASALDPVAGVVEGFIANNAYGYIVTNGIAPVKITGTVNRADRLSHSATSATAATLASLTTFAIALQPSTSAVNSRILANVSITPQIEIATTKGDLLVRNNANEIIRLAVPTTDGFPLTALAANASGWQSGSMSPLAINRGGFRVRRSSNLAIAEATPTDITWQVENWDTNAFITVSATTATIPAGMTGTYHLDLSLTLLNGGGSSRLDGVVEVKVNGTTVQTWVTGNIDSTVGLTFRASMPLALSATDTIKITITMTSSGGTAASRNVVGSSTTSFWALNYMGQSV